MECRIEKDLLGEMQLPRDVLYGIHTARAVENFPISGRMVHPKLISGFGYVKLAAVRVNYELGFIEEKIFSAVEQACNEMIAGMLDGHILVDALQGGAGTSTNMNVNEVIANRALQIMGQEIGRYDIIDPIGTVNLHQSTNDAYPTSLKTAAIFLLNELENEVIGLTETCQQKEHEFADIVKVGRTQLQDAVLTTVGRQFSAYGEAFARDRWRIYKCCERLRVVNLGGTAIGTGLGAPRQYIFKVVDELKNLTGLSLGRAENIIDNTQNCDVFVEVSGILKGLASSLLKVSNDLRVLSSGPDAGIGEIMLPVKQAGSSIMPGKVNPVIPEAVSQAAIMVDAYDRAIFQGASAGNLELNQFMPLIADCLLHSISILKQAVSVLAKNCISGIEVNRDKCQQHIQSSTAVVTALIERIGYKKAEEVVQLAASGNKTVKQVVIEKEILTAHEFEQMISPEAVTKLGFNIKK